MGFRDGNQACRQAVAQAGWLSKPGTPKGTAQGAPLIVGGTLRLTRWLATARFWGAALGAGCALAAAPVWAQTSSAQASASASTATAASNPSPPVVPTVALRPDPEFAHYPRYAGTLGGQAIELLLGPKSDDPGELHGEYHVLATGAVVLVAGERDGDVLQLEESNDGTHISGQWVGRYSANGALEGDRMNDDESEQLSFTLHPAASTVAP